MRITLQIIQKKINFGKIPKKKQKILKYLKKTKNCLEIYDF